MIKIWFILIDGKREGPFSYEDLKNDTRLTPDTLIWKTGFPDWKKIRDVPELKDLFKDEPDQIEQKENEIFDKKATQDEQLVLDFGEEPPSIWLLIAFLTLLYVLIRLYMRN